MASKAVIIGMGLLGGSFGLALKKKALAREVVGMSRSQTSLQRALKREAIDSCASSLPEALKDAQLLLFATPVTSIPTLMKEAWPFIPEGCLVTDVGSTKAFIVSEASRLPSSHERFIGSHPMAGSEKKGVEHAEAGLFEGASVVVTPTEQSPEALVQRACSLWEAMGARKPVSVMSPEAHDRAVALTSHLPQILASLLLWHLGQREAMSNLVGKGFMDTTRLASSDPEMWRDICLTNKVEIGRQVDLFLQEATWLRGLIEAEDAEGLMNFFEKAKALREGLLKEREG